MIKVVEDTVHSAITLTMKHDVCHTQMTVKKDSIHQYDSLEVYMRGRMTGKKALLTLEHLPETYLEIAGVEIMQQKRPGNAQ